MRAPGNGRAAGAERDERGAGRPLDMRDDIAAEVGLADADKAPVPEDGEAALGDATLNGACRAAEILGRLLEREQPAGQAARFRFALRFGCGSAFAQAPT